LNITITTKVTGVSEETKKYTEEKMEKLEKFCKLRKVEIVMEKEGEEYKVDVVVAPERGTTIAASSKAGDWPSAVEDVTDKLERQLRRLKEKTKSHRLKKGQPQPPSNQEDEEETYKDAVNKMKQE